MNGIQWGCVALIVWCASLFWCGFGGVVTLRSVSWMVLIAYVLVWLIWPQSWAARPWRFLACLVYVAVAGTIPRLDPEGRSVRLGFRKAVRYSWQVSG